MSTATHTETQSQVAQNTKAENFRYAHERGRHQALFDKLWEIVPKRHDDVVERPYKDKHLERFRKAQRAYIDLYHNGLGIYKQSFARLFGVAPNEYINEYYVQRCGGYYKTVISERLFDLAERKMDKFVLAAAKEQGFTD